LYQKDTHPIEGKAFPHLSEEQKEKSRGLPQYFCVEIMFLLLFHSIYNDFLCFLYGYYFYKELLINTLVIKKASLKTAIKIGFFSEIT
jgi:hypothetical protein